jgi:hypothetical protein
MQALGHSLIVLLRIIGTFMGQHPVGCSVAVLLLAVLAIVECFYVFRLRPLELTGNGIVIGHAKAFDNRSLALRVERLTASLEQVKVINQDAAENLQAFQQRASSDFVGKISVKPTSVPSKDTAKDPKTDAKPDPAPTAVSADSKLKFGLAATDVLTDQLNLASQIFNLQTLYERSLSDRLIDGQSRLQTVLGFQVSINPPTGFDDCVAITEIAVRLQADPENPKRPEPEPVSLVALMPQDKTYNAESMSSTERSIDGSAVATILTLGATGKQSSKQLFLHRDSDTIAFERTAGTVITGPDAFRKAFRSLRKGVYDARKAARSIRQVADHVSDVAQKMQKIDEAVRRGKKDIEESAKSAETKTEQAAKGPENKVDEVVERAKNQIDEASKSGKNNSNDAASEARISAQSLRNAADTIMEPVDADFDRATVFGWEFRPVLGRSTVSSGTRQLLAVISIPQADSIQQADKQDNKQLAGAILEILTRSYWRRYNRASQTSTPLWSWLPWNVDRSATFVSSVQELFVPYTATAQSSLAPSVSKIKWINTGNRQATIIVSGSNFFTGTKVVIGGVTHSAENNNLTLKSDQALEFETPTDSITTAEAVLSGRFGPAIQLLEPKKTDAVTELSISRAEVSPLRNSRTLRISVDITGRNGEAFTDVTFEFVDSLPNPMLFAGTELLPMPYDYKEMDDSTNKPIANGKKFVRVEAWIPTRLLAKSPSVTFQVPFCGLEYQSSKPLVFSEPTLVRMGEVGTDSIFRIFYPDGMGSSDFNIEFDQTYTLGGPNLTKINETECRFTAPTALVSRFQNIILRVDKAEPYVLPVPPVDKPRSKPSVDVQNAPPQVILNKRGSVEWCGHALDTISEVVINPPGATSPVSQPFAVYAEGTKLMVYLTAGITATEGRLLVECSTVDGDKFGLPLFVVSP